MPVVSIWDGAFFQNFNLTSITIPSSVTSIGRMAFASNGLNEDEAITIHFESLEEADGAFGGNEWRIFRVQNANTPWEIITFFEERHFNFVGAGGN
jgi:hypothetical protein